MVVRTLQIVCLLILIKCIVNMPQRPENSKWNVNFNPDGTDPSKYFGKWDGHNYFPSPEDWRSESIYQFVTDRFADGDPKNNEGKYGGYNLYDVGSRHGGDFKGITNKLYYIKGLGYTTIWISPIFINMENSYHGYAQIDFTLIDERWGTLEDLRELVTEAHKLNIKVIVDIVVNHMADLLYFEGLNNQETPFRMHAGEYRLFWKDENRKYSDFIVDNKFYPNGKYCDVYTTDGVRLTDEGEGSFWFSDFHHNGDLRNYGNNWENMLGKIYGIMDDLRTSHPRVQDKIIAMTNSLISSTDIDGIRMDTPMQVPLTFFKRWTPAVKQHAYTLGKKNFFIFGEFYCSKEKASTMTGRGKTPEMYGRDQFIDGIHTMDGGIHYPLYFWFMNSIKDGNNNLRGMYDLFLRDKIDYDWWNPISRRMEYRHLNFYDNHDQWRLSASENGFLKTNLLSAIIAFWPGIPLFYYGDEQGFLTRNTALDGWSREDFMTSLAWRNLGNENGKNQANEDNFDMTHTSYLWVQKIMNVRKNYSSFNSCDEVTERWTQIDSTNGIFAYTRGCENRQEWVLVIFNTWKQPLEVKNMVTGWNEGDRIVNTLDENEVYTLNKNGALNSVFIHGYGIKAFVLNSSLKPLNLSVSSIFPSHDKSIIDSDATRHKIEIKIAFSKPVEKSSIINNLKFNNQIIPIDKIVWLSENIILIIGVPKRGINIVEINPDVMSSDDRMKLGYFFKSRFRFGLENNIIANERATEDTNLITRVEGNKIYLSHKAEGAEMFRISFEGIKSANAKKWSEWLPYKNSSVHELPQGANEKDITEMNVQYYVDNSAAYFVKHRINRSLKFMEE